MGKFGFKERIYLDGDSSENYKQLIETQQSLRDKLQQSINKILYNNKGNRILIGPIKFETNDEYVKLEAEVSIIKGMVASGKDIVLETINKETIIVDKDLFEDGVDSFDIEDIKKNISVKNYNKRALKQNNELFDENAETLDLVPDINEDEEEIQVFKNTHKGLFNDSKTVNAKELLIGDILRNNKNGQLHEVVSIDFNNEKMHIKSLVTLSVFSGSFDFIEKRYTSEICNVDQDDIDKTLTDISTQYFRETSTPSTELIFSIDEVNNKTVSLKTDMYEPTIIGDIISGMFEEKKRKMKEEVLSPESIKPITELEDINEERKQKENFKKYVEKITSRKGGKKK